MFGSIVCGDDRNESDIYIQIVSQNTEKLESDIDGNVVKVFLDKNEFISNYLMNGDHFNETKNYPFLTNVLEEVEILLYG